MSYKEILSKIARLLHIYWKPIILFILLFFIIIPTCINLAFKYNSGIIILQAEWDASDALSFYGGILAAGLGIYGVFLSIQYAQKNYRDDLKNQVLPYLVVTQLRGLSRYNAFADGADIIKTTTKNSPEENKSADPLYEEYKLTKIYYIIEESGIKNYIDLPSRYKPILEREGASWETVANGCYILQKRPYISFPAEIENVGNGTAIYARIGFKAAPHNC